tara:strand:- start:1297 stop:1455 length:159 start_codon:yes stop_codon:yes gene_type:complete
MTLYEIEAFTKRLEEFEMAIIRSGIPKKFLMDLGGVKQAAKLLMEAEKKRAP